MNPDLERGRSLTVAPFSRTTFLLRAVGVRFRHFVPDTRMETKPMGTYIDVLGHQTWVDIADNDQPPLLLLHGGLTASQSWAGIEPFLSDRHRLIMFDRRGHGRTADSSEPFRYASMAMETAGVIEALQLAPVNVVGYSDGANALLHLALSRPELLQSMVLLSANFHHEALEPEGISSIESLSGINGPVARSYADISPDGADHWPIVAAKGKAMGLYEEPTFTPQELSKITTTALVLASDDEMWPSSHTAALYDALPNAQLAIVPNTSHMLVFEQPAAVAALINAFFDHPGRANTMLPTLRHP